MQLDNWTEVATTRDSVGTDDPDPSIDDDERPARLVTVGSFAVARVTETVFTPFIEATCYLTTAEQEGTGFVVGADNHPGEQPGATWRTPMGEPNPTQTPAGATDKIEAAPVRQISWFDARAYCHWSGHRLWSGVAGAASPCAPTDWPTTATTNWASWWSVVA